MERRRQTPVPPPAGVRWGRRRQLDGALRTVASDLPAGQRAFTQLAVAVLAPVGGPLLEGFHLPAPAHWRSDPAA
jgi:hypothetical protein